MGKTTGKRKALLDDVVSAHVGELVAELVAKRRSAELEAAFRAVANPAIALLMFKEGLRPSHFADDALSIMYHTAVVGGKIGASPEAVAVAAAHNLADIGEWEYSPSTNPGSLARWCHVRFNARMATVWHSRQDQSAAVLCAHAVVSFAAAEEEAQKHFDACVRCLIGAASG